MSKQLHSLAQISENSTLEINKENYSVFNLTDEAMDLFMNADDGMKGIIVFRRLVPLIEAEREKQIFFTKFIYYGNRITIYHNRC